MRDPPHSQREVEDDIAMKTSMRTRMETVTTGLSNSCREEAANEDVPCTETRTDDEQ